jgi:ankyrin repeat protein
VSSTGSNSWLPSRQGAALNAAAKALDLERLQAMVEDGAHPDARDRSGMAALHQAAILGSLPMVDLLLRAGANPCACDAVSVPPCRPPLAEFMRALQSGDTPLHYAAHCGHVDIIIALLQAGADVAAVSFDGTTPLGAALSQGQAAAAQTIADMTCAEVSEAATGDIAAVDAAKTAAGDDPPEAWDARTRAMWAIVAGRLGDACFAGDLSRVRALLEMGADPNAADAWGYAPLHRAAAAGHVSVIEQLISHGASVSAEDFRGAQPLHFACLCGHVDAAHSLLSAGADCHAAARGGLTPATAATIEGHVDVLRLLKSLGVVPSLATLARSKSVLDSGMGAVPVVPVGSRETLPFTSGHELTLTHGIALEGAVKIKRGTGLFRWAMQYLVASRAMRCLLMWSGDESKVEGGEIRWLSFHDIVHVTHCSGGDRFDIVISSLPEPLTFLASSPQEAAAWVSALRKVLVVSQEDESHEKLVSRVFEAVHTDVARTDNVDARLRQAETVLADLRAHCDTELEKLSSLRSERQTLEQAALRDSISSSTSSSSPRLVPASTSASGSPRLVPASPVVASSSPKIIPPTATIREEDLDDDDDDDDDDDSKLSDRRSQTVGSPRSVPESSRPSSPRPPEPTAVPPSRATSLSSDRARRPTARTASAISKAIGSHSSGEKERVLPWRKNQRSDELSRKLASRSESNVSSSSSLSPRGGGLLLPSRTISNRSVIRSTRSRGSSADLDLSPPSSTRSLAIGSPPLDKAKAATRIQSAMRVALARRIIKGWSRILDDDGDVFWYHNPSGKSSWYPPGQDPELNPFTREAIE